MSLSNDEKLTLIKLIEDSKPRYAPLIEEIKGCNIEEFGSLLIKYYADYFSGELNRSLRNTNVKQPLSLFNYYELLLNKALDDIESFDNSIVYRMDSCVIEFEVLKKWYEKRINQIIAVPSFFSTSKYRWPDCPNVFKIKTQKNSKGKNIEPILSPVKASGEREVLFKSNTFFKIIAIDEHEDTINLEETNSILQEPIFLYGNTYINDEEIQRCSRARTPLRLSASESGLI